FGDPTFDYENALAQTTGRIVLRLADADVLPFEFGDFTDTLSQYVEELTKLTDNLRDETAEQNLQIAEHDLEAAADPTQTYVVPAPKAPVPYLNFAPLQNALQRLREGARSFTERMNAVTKNGQSLPPGTQTALDAVFLSLEPALTRPEGLPRRPWYKHFIYAPGFYTGYGVKTLPGVREAIEQRRWTEADAQIRIAADTLGRFADQLNRATAVLARP
ncbi:MAG: folate hydrolase, partial [Verrucomicrobia bacterium]|nr:folate hydrolase [Verrucomicrobiota bacterium]